MLRLFLHVKQLLAVITLVVYAAFVVSAASVSGTVKDDTGAAVPGTIVDIHSVHNFTRDSSGHLVSGGVSFSAAPQIDATGAFSASSLPAGRYYICAYPTLAGYLSNCERPTNAPAINIAETANVTVPLTLTKGTIVQITLADPKGLIGPPVSLTAPSRSAHPFFPGVMNARGYYSAARQVSQTGTQHLYTVTIPKQETVSLFVDSDLSVSTAGGQNVPMRTPSSIKLMGGPATIAVNLEIVD